IVTGKLQQVHVRVNDAATGKPTPCRVRITDESGNYYAPYGRTPRFLTSSADRPFTRRPVAGTILFHPQPWAYIDGTCEIDLPAGTLRVEIRKGPEYRSLDQAISLVPGKLAM